MEAGMQSLWVSSLLTKLGHEVLVANVRELRAITHSDRKSDKVDAQKLARYARLDPQILRPITHRSLEMHRALSVVRTRAVLVRLRTTAVNAVRGLTKPFGYRVPACSTAAFSKRCRTELPADVLAKCLQKFRRSLGQRC